MKICFRKDGFLRVVTSGELAGLPAPQRRTIEYIQKWFEDRTVTDALIITVDYQRLFETEEEYLQYTISCGDHLEKAHCLAKDGFYTFIEAYRKLQDSMGVVRVVTDEDIANRMERKGIKI